MFLAEVADGNNDAGGDALAEEGPPAKYFNKYFKYKIVECKIEYKGKSVAEKLNPSF